MPVQATTDRHSLLHRALVLGYFTLVWNLAEGGIAITAAVVAGSRALLGFGLDSVVESLSATVLAWRLHAEHRDPDRADRVEERALRLIGVTFFVLAAFVSVDSVRALIIGAEPESSPVGIGLTAVSLAAMPLLARKKRVLGTQMASRAMQADSAQTRACAYLSAVVLTGLVLNTAFGWWWADPVAALGVVAFLIGEGIDALEVKAPASASANA